MPGHVPASEGHGDVLQPSLARQFGPEEISASRLRWLKSWPAIATFTRPWASTPTSNCTTKWRQLEHCQGRRAVTQIQQSHCKRQRPKKPLEKRFISQIVFTVTILAKSFQFRPRLGQQVTFLTHFGSCLFTQVSLHLYLYL